MIAASPVPPLSVSQPFALPFAGLLAAHKSCVEGVTIAVIDEDGSNTFIVNVPVVVPEGRLSGVHVTPGNAPQVIATTPANPLFGVIVIVEVPEAIVPPGAGVVVTDAAVALIEKLPDVLPAKVKFNTLFPPNAIGLGSAAPKELTMM